MQTALTLEEKFLIMIQPMIYLSVGVAFYVILIAMGTRLFSKSHALVGNDTNLQNLLNRTIGNTIEQSMIFFPLIFCYLLYQDTPNNIPAIRSIIQIFLVSRLLFAIGYFIGFLCGKLVFRAFGFVMNVGCCLVAVAWHL